jgi:Ca-activated chloride channel family protein
MKTISIILTVIFAAALVIGTLRDENFWRTPDRRGDLLLRRDEPAEAAKVYTDPWRIGVAQYRNGDFKEAAKTFARVPGADGAFDQGNASLMHGNYDGAMASYDRALRFRPNWREAEENKALAAARKKVIEDAGKDRDKEQTDNHDDEETPDAITYDLKGQDAKAEPPDLAGDEMTDDQLRATWLRRVQTTPGDFLRAKFGWQAAQAAHKAGGEEEK